MVFTFGMKNEMCGTENHFILIHKAFWYKSQKWNMFFSVITFERLFANLMVYVLRFQKISITLRIFKFVMGKH